LCRSCSRVAGGASSPDFARILLTRERKRSTRGATIARTALAIAVPGYGLVLHHRVWRAAFLWLVLGATLIATFTAPWAYAARPRFAPGLGASPIAPLAIAAAVYGLSWLGYLGELRRARRRATAEASSSSSRSETRTRLHGPREEAA
jgi:hypothetical protein